MSDPERAAQLVTLALEVAEHLPGWGAVSDPDAEMQRWNPSGRLADEAGRTIDIHFERGTKTKLTCIGSLPPGERPYGLYVPTIGCTLTRGAQAIAADLQRRLIPDLLAGWQRTLDYQVEREREYRARHKTARALARICGARVPQFHDEPHRRTDGIMVSPPGLGRYDVDTAHGKVRVLMELRDLPAALAVQVAELVATYERLHNPSRRERQ